MPRWIVLLILATVAPVAAAQAPPVSGDAPAQAERDWQAAAAHYHAAGDRARSAQCLRRLAQSRRTADPDARRAVAATKPADALNLYAEAVEALGRLYADPAAATPAKLFAHGVDELAAALADPAFRDAHLANPSADAVERFRADLPGWAAKTPDSPAAARRLAFELAADAQARLGVRHPAAVVLELVHGAAHGLDPYTAYAPPVGADPHAGDRELAEYGLTLRATAHGVEVAGVALGSWAEHHSGLHAGDKVVRVNGAKAGGDLAAALRSPDAGGHYLELEAADDPAAGPDAVVGVRLPVPAPSVYAVGAARPGVGYLRVGAFRPSTPAELDAALAELRGRNVHALVVDLRGNPGGSLAAALAVAGRFLPAGPVAQARGQAPEFARTTLRAPAGGPAWAGPLVVMVNGRTASAAEVVAAALQDRGRAAVAGTPSFGKGVVQSPPVPLAAGALTVTVATLLTPSGRPLDGRGVTPDTADLGPALEKAAGLVGK